MFRRDPKTPIIPTDPNYPNYQLSPFDVEQMRTIPIDTSGIYSLVPQLETYRSEIATHVRQALASPETVSNPLTVFCPGFTVSLPVGAT